MKRLLLIVALVVVFAVPAYAAPPGQLNYGCGLGAVVFKDGGANDSVLLQNIATCLNGTGSASIGITVGTSECAKPAKFVGNERLNEFAYKNLDDLARDIAAGQGEAVSTMAVLLDVPAAQRPAFYRNLQASFTEIFPTPTVDTAYVVEKITAIAAKG